MLDSLIYKELISLPSRTLEIGLIQPLIAFLQSQKYNLQDLVSEISRHDKTYELINYLFTQLPKNSKLCLQLLQFLNDQKNGQIQLRAITYLNFKTRFYKGEDREALMIYQKYLAKSNQQLTGDEYFRLGNVIAYADRNTLNNTHKDMLLKACRFFYQGHEQGDNDCKRLLLTTLNAIKALDSETPYVDSLTIDNKAIETLLFNFEKMYKKEQLLRSLNVFIKTHKINAFSFYTNSKHKHQLTLANEIKKSLVNSKNLPNDVIAELNVLKKSDVPNPLFKLLVPFIDHPATPLNLSGVNPQKSDSAKSRKAPCIKQYFLKRKQEYTAQFIEETGSLKLPSLTQ